MTDAFGIEGRRWLAALEPPVDERLTVVGCLRQLDFLGEELARADRVLAEQVVDDREVRRLMTIPGVHVTTAATLVAVIGDIRRFPSARHRVGYLGLHPTVRQSATGPARHGRTSKEGSAAARHVLVEAAWSAARSPGPLRAFAERTAARRGRPIAAVAVARKLAVLAWQLLTRGQDYAFAQPGQVQRKLRMLEPAAGAPRRKSGPNGRPVWPSPAQQRAEKRLAEQAEAAYRRLISDWQATGPRAGAGATPERASQRPSKGKAARQAHCSRHLHFATSVTRTREQRCRGGPRPSTRFDFHLFEGGPDVKLRAHHLLAAVGEDVLSSLSALAGASCRSELSRLLNSVVGRQAAR